MDDDRYCPDDCPHLRPSPFGRKSRDWCVAFCRALWFEDAGELRDLRCAECLRCPPEGVKL